MVTVAPPEAVIVPPLEVIAPPLVEFTNTPQLVLIPPPLIVMSLPVGPMTYIQPLAFPPKTAPIDSADTDTKFWPRIDKKVSGSFCDTVTLTQYAGETPETVGGAVVFASTLTVALLEPFVKPFCLAYRQAA